ncbi:MAG: 1-acyl-sn-glycerol-3-phosphate acyltransferase [Proteobacteria bacterium]|nr:MAG: 1-acyl-sn-glycerol-3-phosphate acyltransferase [Pseudomonadota bacterium]
MIRTFFWYLYFWLYMLFSLLLVIPVILLSLPGLHKQREKYIQFTVSTWAKSLIRAAGGTVQVTGSEHLPEQRTICYIANHQGAFDIPIILGHLPGAPGFIAKKELALLPIVNIWMKSIGCLFIDRSNRRAAIASITKGVKQLQSGKSIILFPEGTRSRGPKMNSFKQGSLKLPIRSRTPIVPITISGSYQLKEEKGRIHPGTVSLTIHQPIDSTGYREDETKRLSDELTRVISSAL